MAFSSKASNLIPQDENFNEDIFVYDRETNTTTRVSVTPEGGDANSASGGNRGPALSADGRFVAFASSARNLIPDDTNDRQDVFVYDRQTKTTTRVSEDAQGAGPNNHSGEPRLSWNGRYVAFQSLASNLVVGDTNGWEDVFVYDRQSKTTMRVSVTPEGGNLMDNSFNPALSGNGRFVGFATGARNVLPDDGNREGINAFAYDRLKQTTSFVSVDVQRGGGRLPASSGNGRFVSFESMAGFPPTSHIFLHD